MDRQSANQRTGSQQASARQFSIQQNPAVPPNLIPPQSAQIAPGMLTLIDLDAEEIRQIAHTVPGGAANIQDIYPLAPLQEGMFFHSILGTGDPYVLPTILQFDSRSHLDAFIEAIQEVIRRHDILRTAILWEQLSRPVQVVHRVANLVTEKLEIDAESDPVQRLAAYMDPEHQRLDLRTAPLLRLLTARVGNDPKCYGLLQVHHLVCDQWSLNTVIAEVKEILDGNRARLPEPIPYRNHVYLALIGAQSPETANFFSEKLGDVTEPTAPFGESDTHSGGARTLEANLAIDTQLGDRIRKLARRVRATPSTLFHAAWALVVAQFSGKADIVFGTVLFGRQQLQSESQSSVGMFINTLPLRLKIEGLSVLDLVLQARQELWDLLGHEQASLPFVQRRSSIAGSSSLFNTLLNYRFRAPGQEVSWTHEQFGIREVTSRVWTSFPVTLAVDDFGSRFEITVQSESRIDPRRIIHFMSQTLDSLICALERFPAIPALKITRLPPSEHHQVLEIFNDTDRQRDPGDLIHVLFERQVAKTPDAIAVWHAGRQLTYAELNNRANQLAAIMIRRSIGPEQLVGLYLHRSIDLIVSLLGVLKTGAAYVPMDPEFPPDRLAYMLTDAAPRIVLTQSSLKASLPSTTAEAIVLDDSPNLGPTDRIPNPDPGTTGVTSTNLAYVIYTSGSTGVPKGVMIGHAAVVNLLKSMEHTPGLDAGDCILNLTTISFDIAGLEIYLPLIRGARLVLADAMETREPHQIARLLDEQSVTVLQATPTTWQLLLGAGWRGRCVMKGLSGGEALKTSLSRALRNRVSSLWNLYGPTETTIWSCAHPIAPQSDSVSAVECIGSPIDNTRVYILDQFLRPTPIGVAGDIYIGGTGVARGYWKRPLLTAERFPNNLFGADTQARMYKTGDKGRWTREGTIDYLGRDDDQVKVRGFRIELQEIEAQLTCHELVEQAAVVVREVYGEKQLTAYIVANRHADSEPAHRGQRLIPTLRRHLQSRLPDYMVPTAWKLLTALPITPNGKIDKQALPAPEGRSEQTRQYVEPREPSERTLADTWSKVLHVDRVGAFDNFFELGGNSLLSVKLVDELRRQGIAAEVRRLFEKPVLADFAHTLEIGVARGRETPPNLIPPDCSLITAQMLTMIDLSAAEIQMIAATVAGGMSNIEDIYPLAPLQEGLLFHNLVDREHSDVYLRSILLELPSDRHLQTLIEALQRLIDRHTSLRTAFLFEELRRPVQAVVRRATLHTEWVGPSARPNAREHAMELLRADGQRLDLTKPPLLQVKIVHNLPGPALYVLLQTHHLVCDNGSIGILLAEIVAHFRSATMDLPEAVPYREHVWQALTLSQARDSESFFRSKLGDIDEPTAPFGLLDIHSGGNSMQRTSRTLDAHLVQLLRMNARKFGVTAATIFHSVWALVVAHTSGRSDVVYGTVLLGRMQGSAGAQRILGMFINTLPLRLKVDGLSADALLKLTHTELLELLGHEQAPLKMARSCSKVEGGIPLFSTILNFRHRSDAHESQLLRESGIELLGFAGGSNYTLSLSVEESTEGFNLEIESDRRIQSERLMSCVVTAVRGFIDALQSGLSDPALGIPLLSGHERDLVTLRFNATARARSGKQLVHRRFEDQVMSAPGKVALLCGESQLTYEDLNTQSNRLARLLIELGVHPDDRVALYVERSPEMIIGMLAVLKAGCAYVPLDVSYPLQRILHMVQDSAPVAILTSESVNSSVLPSGSPVLVIQEARRMKLPEAYCANPDPEERGTMPGHLAYMIYTSGSTGVPKGVMISHGSLANLIEWYCSTTGMHDRSGVSSVAAFGFDATVMEIWPPLSVGATLFLPPYETGRQVDSLLEWWFRQPLDISFLPTPVAELSFGRDSCHQTLNTLLVGGDKLRQRRKGVPFVLVNNYGPTESTVVATSGVIHDDDTVFHIGRPIENTQIYILDAYYNPVPIGVPGELFIAGTGLARGYSNRPDLTAERFVPNPFAGNAGNRMYKTGDVGRWCENGNIEFLGRSDDQIKIRGVRIEPREIESRLLENNPSISEAVVTAIPNDNGESRLVAYLTMKSHGHDELPMDIDAVRQQLRAFFPEYMIPSAFVTLDHLPLTPNGKLNRKALPLPQVDSHTDLQYEAPQGALEEALAAIWTEVLQIKKIGRHDNFFSIGGHSLLGVKLALRVGEVLQVRPPVVAIFQCPTIYKMTQLVEQLRAQSMQVTRTDSAGEHEDELPPIRRRVANEPIPLTFSQLWLWNSLCLQTEPSLRSVHVALRLSGPLNQGFLTQSLEELIRRHEPLRTRIISFGESPTQHIDSSGQCELQMIDLGQIARADRDARLQHLVEEFIYEPVNASAGPLFAARIIKIDNNEHVLVIAIDHLVADATSAALLLRELITCYKGLSRGIPQKNQPPIIQLADYAVWQKKTRDIWRGTHMAHWSERLSVAKRLRVLHDSALDLSKPHWLVVPVEFGPALSSAMQDCSARLQTSVVMLTFTAYIAAILRWYNESCIVVPFLTAGRSVAQIAQSVGPFGHPIYLRIIVSREDTFTSLLARIIDEFSLAVQHDDSCEIAATNPTPDFVRNPAFSWNPDAISSEIEPGPGSQTSLSFEQIELPIRLRDSIEWEGEPRLDIAPTSKGFRGVIKCRSASFSRESIDALSRMFQHFAALITRDPATNIADVDVKPWMDSR